MISELPNDSSNDKVSRSMPWQGRVLLFHLLAFNVVIGILFTDCIVITNNDMDTILKDKSEISKRDIENQHLIFLEGTLELVSNPCLSEPCLPGQVYALFKDHTHYILVHQKEWTWGSNPFVWNDIQLTIGEHILVEGKVSEHLDLKKKPYFQLDIVTLKTR